MATDPFAGTWRMDPARNDFEMGVPPVEGLYVIEATEDGYHVSMSWTEQGGDERSMAYDGVPDGAVHPYDDPQGPVDGMSMTRVDERTLDSSAMMGDVRLAYARRALSEDGQEMTVTQSANLPDGGRFTNTSVYTRVS